MEKDLGKDVYDVNHKKSFSCRGFLHPYDHPNVFFKADSLGRAQCPYCGKKFSN